MLSFFPRGVLDEILNLIESVPEGFHSYSSNLARQILDLPRPNWKLIVLIRIITILQISTDLKLNISIYTNVEAATL